MNDREEVRYGARMLLGALEGSALDAFLPRSGGTSLNEAKDKVVANLRELSDGPAPGQSYFAFCFSEEADQLGQWRGYADDGRGLVLEYEASQLVRLRDSDGRPATLAPIHYGAAPEPRLADHLRSIFQQASEGVRDPHARAENRPVSLPLLAATFKHEGFREEREFRLLVDGDPDETLLTPRGPRPVRFLRWPGHVTDRFPRRLVLGPGAASQANVDAIRDLLRKAGATVTTDESDFGPRRIVIARSSIPYLSP